MYSSGGNGSRTPARRKDIKQTNGANVSVNLCITTLKAPRGSRSARYIAGYSAASDKYLPRCPKNYEKTRRKAKGLGAAALMGRKAHDEEGLRRGLPCLLEVVSDG
jgi:hypothetical protein